MKIIFLGTPDFVQSVRDTLTKNFTLVDSLEDADLGVVAAYGRILTKEELNTPRFGMINVHPSLLPKYRGPSPIQAAILNGDKTSGITIIKIDEKMDHGPIIYQETLELGSSDNCDTLSTKMFHRASEILPQIIKDFIAGKIKLLEQDHTKATYCPLLTKKSGFFDINQPPQILDQMIHAYYPWPGVWTRWSTYAKASGDKNDKIIKFYPEGKIQMEGKKVMSMKDFLNGYPNFPLKSITLDKK